MAAMEKLRNPVSPMGAQNKEWLKVKVSSKLLYTLLQQNIIQSI
jgi:hypothetical protein